MTLHLSRRSALGLLAGAAAAPLLAQRRDELEVPYVPTPEELVERMLDLAGVGASDYLIDLGCGDGRIAVAAGRRGARALGVDLDGMRLQQAGAGARRAGVQGRVSFRRQDLFETPIYEASVIALYLLPAVNLRLRPRLLTELPAGARVVSHAFDMGDWEPDAREEHDGRRIFLWLVPAVAGGQWLVTLADGTVMLLELEQRFQNVAGTLTSDGRVMPLSDVTLRGDRLRFTADGKRLAAIIDGAEMRDDAAAPGERGWRAVRSE